jgi:hypothetical protein
MWAYIKEKENWKKRLGIIKEIAKISMKMWIKNNMIAYGTFILNLI